MMPDLFIEHAETNYIVSLSVEKLRPISMQISLLYNVILRMNLFKLG